MPQTSMPLGPVPGTPGQLFDEIGNCDIVSGRVSSLALNGVIQPGVIVEMDANGNCVPLSDATTGGAFAPKILGVVAYDPMGAMQNWQQPTVPPSTASSTFPGYAVGVRVPILRRGRLWVLWDASVVNGALPNLGQVNVRHSSTGANPQGVVTTLAASAVAGNEIDQLGNYAQVWQPAAAAGEPAQGTFTTPFGLSYSIALMQWNLPGRA